MRNAKVIAGQAASTANQLQIELQSCRESSVVAKPGLRRSRLRERFGGLHSLARRSFGVDGYQRNAIWGKHVFRICAESAIGARTLCP
jgi:hypothetical protein